MTKSFFDNVKNVIDKVKTFRISLPTAVLLGGSFLVGYITGSVMKPIQKQQIEISTSAMDQRIPSPKEVNPPVEEVSPTEEETSSVSEPTPWYMKPEEVLVPTSKGTVSSGPDDPNPPGT